MKIAVVGAGIAGRLSAWQCLQQFPEAKISLLAKDFDQQGVCSFVAAGMLAPVSELESEPVIGNAEDSVSDFSKESLADVFSLGQRSLQLWPSWLKLLNEQGAGQVFYQSHGTLVVSHRQDRPHLTQFYNTLHNRLATKLDQFCSECQVQEVEPELSALGSGLLLSSEAQVDSHQVMNALEQSLKHSQVNFRQQQVQKISAGLVDGEIFDWVFDCRGLALRDDDQAKINMQGVRGEVAHVYAPDVNLHHMVRVMHPRYRIYIVPRENHHFLIGATEIDSEDDGPMSLRSCLELLSAAYSVHKGFAEARIVELRTGLRPATFDRQPLLEVEQGLIRINGLYRHGYLLAPSMVEQALKKMKHHIDKNK